MLVDSHCHLDFPDFRAELDDVVARARRAGVGAMVTICTHLSRFEQVLGVAERFPDVVCTVGVHPHHADAEAAGMSVAKLVACAAHAKVVGIGESGLDYYYDKSPRDTQQTSFRQHIRACLEARLPLVVHTRDAEADTMALLREEAAGAGLSGVMHCFSGSRWLAEEALDFGFAISFSGMVTFKRAEELRTIAAMVPTDRLLLETDAPYLAPVPMRGKRNEPAYVVHTARVIAEARGLTAEAVAKQTGDNFHRWFPRAAAVLAPLAGAA